METLGHSTLFSSKLLTYALVDRQWGSRAAGRRPWTRTSARPRPFPPPAPCDVPPVRRTNWHCLVRWMILLRLKKNAQKLEPTVARGGDVDAIVRSGGFLLTRRQRRRWLLGETS